MKVSIPIGRNIFEIECNDIESSSLIKSCAMELNKRVNNVLKNFEDIDNQTAIVFTALFLLQESKNAEKPRKKDEKVQNIEYQDSLFPEEIIKIPKYMMETLISKLSDLEHDIQNLKL